MKLIEIKNSLKKNIVKGENSDYSIPEMWNSINYADIKSRKKEEIKVNPYKFYYEVISSIIDKSDNSINYCESLATYKDKEYEKDFLPGDWINKSIIYSMHVRTSTTWDHNKNTKIESINIEGYKETGTFIKTISLLPLLKEMGISSIYLLPISLHSRKYKKGEMGSPYSVKNFYEIDSELGDPLLENIFTLEEQFQAFVEACHILGISVILDIMPRTCSRDNDLIMEHPDWFYWIKVEDIKEYGPPQVQGIEEFSRVGNCNTELIYNSDEVKKHIRKFTQPPNILSPTVWDEIVIIYKKNPHLNLLDLIENKIGITTAPGFSDCINDAQPPWTDITFFRLFLDHPTFVKKFVDDDTINPYILYDTIKADIFKGENKNNELWEYLSNILPYFQRKFGIDGVRIDMGHALPDELITSIIENAREVDQDFAFIAEEFDIEEGESLRKKGFNLMLGNGFYCQPRIKEGKTHDFIYNAINLNCPILACGETPDSPRLAARDGDKKLSKLLTIINHFIPNTVPFVNSGLELYEKQPMNIGIDCSSDEHLKLKGDPLNGKLAFFDAFYFNWTTEDRWDLPNTLKDVSRIRKRFFYNSETKVSYIDTFSGKDDYSYICIPYEIRIGTTKMTLIIIGNFLLNEQNNINLDLKPITNKVNNNIHEVLFINGKSEPIIEGDILQYNCYPGDSVILLLK